jgi:hypothetical protein
MKELLETVEHKYKGEIESLKLSHKNDLDTLDEKVKEALIKKNSTI